MGGREYSARRRRALGLDLTPPAAAAAAAREERVGDWDGRRLGVGVEVEQKGLAAAEEEEAMVVGSGRELAESSAAAAVAAGLALIKEGNRRNVTRSDQQTGGG
jgi:hypothetical protein